MHFFRSPFTTAALFPPHITLVARVCCVATAVLVCLSSPSHAADITVSGPATDVIGSAGPDTITLAPTGNVVSDITADDGADVLHLNGGAVGGRVFGGDGSDTINLNGTTITGSLFGNDGIDIINLSSGSVDSVDWGSGDESAVLDLSGVTVSGDLVFGVGMDDFTLNDGAAAGSVILGQSLAGTSTDADRFTLNGGLISTSVFGDSGIDTVTLNGGVITGSLSTNSGNDVIEVNGTARVGKISAGVGDDQITLNSGTGTTSAENIQGHAGNDTIVINGGSWGQVFGDRNTISFGQDILTMNGGTVVLLAGDSNSTSSGSSDLISLFGGTVTGDVAGEGADDDIRLEGGNVLRYVRGDDGADTITLNGTTVSLDIRGGNGVDTINLNSGSARDVDWGAGDEGQILDLSGVTLGRNLIFGSGADTFTLNGGSVTSVMLGASASLSSSSDTDSFTLNGAAVSGTVYGDAGSDTVSLLSGSAGTVTVGDGNDTIRLDGATVTSSIQTGNGEDLIQLFSGSVAEVYSNAGDDTVTLNGATVTTFILTDAGNDTVNLLSGSVGVVGTDAWNAAAGNDEDTVTLNGATVSGYISTWRGNNTVYLLSGNGSHVSLHDGEDYLLLDGAIMGEIYAQNQDDTLDLRSGSATRVVGQEGTDRITLDGATITEDIWGGFLGLDMGVDADMITLNAGSVGGTVYGNGGDDTITLNNVAVTGDIHGGDLSGTVADGNDTIWLNGGSVGGGVFGNDGNDTITLNGSTVTDRIDGGAGNDTIDLLNGSVGHVDGGDDNDTITLNGAHVTSPTTLAGGAGNDTLNLFSGSVINVDAGDGDDTITWTAADVSGQILAGLGSDTLDIAATADLSAITLFDGGDFVGTADMMIDTLTFNNVTAVLNGATLQNWENIIVNGGHLTITDNTFAAGTDPGVGVTLSGGSLFDAGSGMALSANLAVNAGSTFRGSGSGTGTFTIAGDLTNAGSLTLQDGFAGDLLVIGGDYSGSGQLSLDADFGTSTADRLFVAGSITGAPTALNVSDAGSGAAAAAPVEVVRVFGTTTDADFLLPGGPVTSGAYSYDLARQGQSWFLTPSLLPETPMFEATSRALLMLNTLPTMQQRTGNRYWIGAATRTVDHDEGLWIRSEFDGSHTEYSQSTTGLRTNSRRWLMQMGLGGRLLETENGILITNVTTHYGQVGMDVRSGTGNGRIDTTGLGCGFTATWFHDSGFYVDTQCHSNWFDTDLTGPAGSAIEGNNGIGYAAGIESGIPLQFTEQWSLTPQTQLTWSRVDFDTFSDAIHNAQVSLDEADSMRLRLGIAASHTSFDRNRNHRKQRRHLYLAGNIHHEFLGDSTTFVSGTPLSGSIDDWTAEIGLGGSCNWGIGGHSLYGELNTETGLHSFGRSYRCGLNLGYRIAY